MTMTPPPATPYDMVVNMPTPDELARQAEALRRVSRARLRRGEATQEYDAAILAALDTGAAVSDIARAAGVTRQWVSKLDRRRRQ